VEHEAQALYLRTAGCDRMQGYFFARPMPADDVEALFKTAEKPRRRVYA
jgi:diguanylate cyclase